MIFMGEANETQLIDICTYVGFAFAVIGLGMGRKLYLDSESPSVLFWSSSNVIFDNIVFSCIVWAVRMFCVPFILVCIFKMITEG